MTENQKSVRMNMEQQQGLLVNVKDYPSPEKPKENLSSQNCTSLKGIKYILVSGTIAIAFGITSCIWTPYQFLMNQRLFMYPGLPPYEWWLTPPDIFLNVYVFNYTNFEDFLNGKAAKLNVEEIGPIVYVEHVEHTGVRFNDNGTLTYISNRTAILVPERTTIDLNTTIITPNLALIGIASFLKDASFFTKLGFNLLAKRSAAQPFLEVSINDFLWNFTDPILETAHTYFRSLAPTNNMGFLERIYADYIDEVTVFIGAENERRYFTMSNYRGSEYFKFRKREQCDRVDRATEGISYHHSIHKTDKLFYFRKKVCRTIPVEFSNEIIYKDLVLYRFEITPTLFNRPENISADCFTEEGEKPLPSGVINIAPCVYDFPFGISWPHFLYGEPNLTESIDGLKADKDKHVSYLIVEPNMGIPMKGSAKMQSNLLVADLSGFSNLRRFSNKVLPIIWFEYVQEDLPWYIYYLVYLSVVVVPPLQTVTTGLMLCFGFGCLLYIISTMIRSRSSPLKFFPLKLLSPISSVDLDRL